MTPKLTRFFQDKHGKYVIAQPPNLPALVFVIAAIVRLVSHGSVHHTADLMATGAAVAWSILEIWSGVSPFRRTLGVIVLLAVLYKIVG